MRALVMLLVLCCAVAAQAAVLDVPADYATFADAVAAGAAGDTVRVAAGTYSDSSVPLFYGGLVFIADGEVVMNGATGSEYEPVFYVSYDVEGDPPTQFQDFRFEGNSVAFNLDMDAALDFVDCSFVDNDHVLFGCAGSTVTLLRCSFEGNHSPYFGAALYPCLWRILAEDCVFTGNSAGMQGGAVYLDVNPVDGPHQFERCLFVGNVSPGGAAVYVDGGDAVFRNCVFWGNSDGPTIEMEANNALSFENCIVAGNGDKAFACPGDLDLAVSCTVVHGNAGGDWTDCAAGLLGVDGNADVSPQFCDPEGGDFQVYFGSYCLPENNPCGELIGLYGWGCGTTGTEESSWSQVKSLY
ncbi:MAG: hypothetical protein R3C71_07720 [Candidatus Krumholzibacteriia bacterium]